MAKGLVSFARVVMSSPRKLRHILTQSFGTSTVARDDRKTAKLATWSPRAPLNPQANGTLEVHNYELARGVLRAPQVEQSGFGADIMRGMKRSLMRLPMLFVEGEQHQEQRRATAKFFSPKWAEENYRDLIERETTRLIEDLRHNGTGRLDRMAMDMSVAVAAEIVGLSHHVLPGMPDRISRFFDQSTGWVTDVAETGLADNHQSNQARTVLPFGRSAQHQSPSSSAARGRHLAPDWPRLQGQ